MLAAASPTSALLGAPPPGPQVPPGSAAALTVGAVDRTDAMAEFSSRGPTAGGSLKPDLTAPGVDIVAAKAAEGTLGDPAADGCVSMSGTSMATPHVAGAAAILAQRHPDRTGEQSAPVFVRPPVLAPVSGSGGPGRRRVGNDLRRSGRRSSYASGRPGQAYS